MKSPARTSQVDHMFDVEGAQEVIPLPDIIDDRLNVALELCRSMETKLVKRIDRKNSIFEPDRSLGLHVEQALALAQHAKSVNRTIADRRMRSWKVRSIAGSEVVK